MLFIFHDFDSSKGSRLLPLTVAMIQPKRNRFTIVVFGVTASPFVYATVLHLLELHYETHGDLVLKLLQLIYANDIMRGSQTKEQANQLYCA